MKLFFAFFILSAFFPLLLFSQTIISHPPNNSVGAKPADSTLVPPTVCIIPQPNKLTLQTGDFTVNSKTVLVIPEKNAPVRKTARFFTNRLLKVDGTNIQIKDDHSPYPAKNVVLFQLKPDDVRGGKESEWYQLDVAADKITVVAGGEKGIFYAVQSLLQLLPPEVFSPNPLKRKAGWKIPCVSISDEPRFAYRGLHLDVGRHFFPPSFVKKYIDLIALHKMNTFHWHLTEDQGWRIEIKKYPKLTSVGSIRKETLIGKKSANPQYDGKPYGGFYTQQEIKDVVAYAKEKYVTIIPEIELPGHSLAALSAYPEYSCDPTKKYEAATTWGVFEDIFCPTDSTINFLKDVLTEVMDLFPGKYVHIGGDEAPKKAWKESAFVQDLIKREGLKDEHEVQTWLIKKMEAHINARGKRLIGWDEILEGGLSPDATVMSWRGVNGGIAAARQLHDVIMTPTTFVYLDYYQFDPAVEPLAIGGFLPLEKVYSYDPMPDSLTAEQAKHILGAQANLWTEYLTNGDMVEYMAYPRACALAEVAWSPLELKNYPDFKARLSVHLKRLKYLGVNYCDKEFNPVAAANK